MLVYSKYWKSITPFWHCHAQDNFLTLDEVWLQSSLCAIIIFNQFSSMAFKKKEILPKMLTFCFCIFLKFLGPFFCDPPPSPTLLGNQSFQVFLINRNATVKLSSINIHVKYMLGNVYIDKIHARQSLYIISLYFKEGFSHSFNFCVLSKGIFHI